MSFVVNKKSMLDVVGCEKNYSENKHNTNLYIYIYVNSDMHDETKVAMQNPL